MEELIGAIARDVALVLESISVLLVSGGAVESLYRLLWPLARGQATHEVRRAAWLSLARWLLLGLEFMLAADIVRTAISPTWNDLGQLGAIAAIRTFLNYFLERDLETATHIRGAE
jgi:uncharacterized membrane protein